MLSPCRGCGRATVILIVLVIDYEHDQDYDYGQSFYPCIRILTIRERRDIYMVTHGSEEPDDGADFEPPERSRDVSDFGIES